MSIMPTNPKYFNVDNVRVVKIMGGSLAGSKVVQGMVFGREPEGKFSQFSYSIFILNIFCLFLYNLGVIKKVTRGKVAVFTTALDIAQTETKGTVLIKNADEMLNFTTGEEKHIEKVRHKITFDSFDPNLCFLKRSLKRSQTPVSKSSSQDQA